MIDFRFMVIGEHNGLYGVKDLEDLVTEWFSYDEVIRMSSVVEIKGVDKGSIDTEWFYSYYAKLVLVKGDDYVINLTGLACINGELSIVLGVSFISYNHKFIDFVNNFKTYMYNEYSKELSEVASTINCKELKKIYKYSRLCHITNKSKIGYIPLSIINSDCWFNVFDSESYILVEKSGYIGRNLLVNNTNECSVVPWKVKLIVCEAALLRFINCYVLEISCDSNTKDIARIFIGKDFDLSHVYLGDIKPSSCYIEEGVDLFSLYKSFKYTKLVEGVISFYYRAKYDLVSGRLDYDNNIKSYFVLGINSKAVMDYSCCAGFYFLDALNTVIGSVIVDKQLYIKCMNESDDEFMELHNTSKDLFSMIVKVV